MGRILLLVGVICWFALAARAEVDQAVLIPGGASFYYHNVRAPFQWAQTFTVGAAGQLAQIDLQVFKNPQAALGLTVDVRATSSADGSPQQADAPLLASVVLSPGALPSTTYPNVQPYVPVDLRAFDIRVTPGEVLAIVLRSDEPDEPFNRGFEWSASPQGSDV